MGIIEETLAEFELSDGTEYTVEYNADGTIHMHIDSLRIVFSTEEFERFVRTVSEGHTTLDEMKEE
ncbi:hypothetical protein [Halorhabdus salina]|uniref:hypothetical protein n=1 Tax=Halorhabdus salina TaxID=2750670 RepID=UPI0015EFABF0|nr:hypothetical protein [Halorhabdus salina]